MLDDKNSWTSNDYETLMGLTGETVRRFVTVSNRLDRSKRDWVFVFESGWSLQINDTLAFWVNNPSKTKQILKSEYERRRGFIESLEEVEYALKVFDTSEQSNNSLSDTITNEKVTEE